MEEEGKVSSCSAAEDTSDKEEIWCLRRVGKTSDWLRLFEDTEVTVGRGVNVTYQLLSPSYPLMISRQHCVFKQNEDGQWTVTDRKSLNGVWINGGRIAPERAWPLSAGDSVRLGVPVEGVPVEFEYELVQDTLQAVRPFLIPPRPGAEATPRAKKSKRKLEGAEPDPQSRAKLYRCAGEGWSQSRPCPPAQTQPGEAPGPSVPPAGPRSDLSPACPRRLGDSVRHAQQRLSGQQDRRPEHPVRHEEVERSQHEEELKKRLEQEEVLKKRLEREEVLKKRLEEEEVLKKRLEEEEVLKKRLEAEEVLKKRLEEALQEQRKVMEELKCSRQGFEEILQAKDKELEVTKEEKEQARAQKDEVVIQMTDVLENELQCIICSELFIEAVTLSCAHSFCLHCIAAWRRRSGACPICRQDILSQTRSLVLDNCIDRMVESLSTELKERRQALIAERKGQPVEKAVLLLSDDDEGTSSSSDSSAGEFDAFEEMELFSYSQSPVTVSETSLSLWSDHSFSSHDGSSCSSSDDEDT